MLDISRDKVPTISTLRDLVQLLSLLGYNQLQLYTEHTFAFTGHERVWGAASPLTAAEVRELDIFCADHGIELVPNLNSLGHFERWLQHADYQHLAECPRGITLPTGRILPKGTTLHPSDASLRFLASLYDEYLPHFRSKRFNAGLDEPWELGLGKSSERCQQTSKHEVYLQHLGQVAALAKARGKSIQFWADIVLEDPETVARLPSGVEGVIWGYEADHPFEEQCKRFSQCGVPYFVAPGTGTWNSIGGRWPTARANILNCFEAAQKYGANGVLLTDWGDNGHHQPFAVSLPALVLVSMLQAAREIPSDDAISDRIDALVGDSSRKLGRSLLAMGSCWTLLPQRIRNQSVLWRLFFASSSEQLGLLGDTPTDALSEVEDILDQTLDSLAAAQPSRFGGLLLRRECEVSARMLRNGIRRAREAKLDITPQAKRGPNWAELTSIIGQYEQVWLERNRPGGLYESSGRIRALLK